MSIARRIVRVGAVAAVTAMVMSGCGSSGSGSSSNAVKIEMRNYAFSIDGEVTAGESTIETSNTSDEFHMLGLGKLKDGNTFSDVEDVIKQMSQGGDEGGGEGDTSTTEGALASPSMELIAQTSSTTTADSSTTTAPAEEGGGEEGGEGEDPLSALITEVGAPGHFLPPGGKAAITTDNLTAGSYVLICFLPNPDGAPHFAKGMYTELKVKEGKSTDTPKADADIVFDDSGSTIPSKLESGEVTLKATMKGTTKHELGVVKVNKKGATFDEIDEYFTQTFEESETLPTAAEIKKGPAEIVAFLFDAEEPDELYLTVNLEPGTYLIGCDFTEDDGTSHGAKEMKMVTVT